MVWWHGKCMGGDGVGVMDGTVVVWWYDIVYGWEWWRGGRGYCCGVMVWYNGVVLVKGFWRLYWYGGVI